MPQDPRLQGQPYQTGKQVQLNSWASQLELLSSCNLESQLSTPRLFRSPENEALGSLILKLSALRWRLGRSGQQLAVRINTAI